jgi:hypothetical protein
MRADALILIAIFVSLAAAPAAAEPPGQTERDVAREITRSGAEYYDNGDWEKAQEHFHRAYELIKAPTLALMEARALVKLGRLVQASEAYARAANAVDQNNEPYRKAAADARTELSTLRQRVPTIRVVVPSDDALLEVRVDGKVVAKEALGSPVAVDPGTHVVAISRPGSADRWESIRVGEGEERTLRVEAARPMANARGKDDSPSPALKPVMWTAFGVGGAGIAVGVVTGALALDRKATLDRACAGTTCPPSASSDLDSFHELRTASTIGYLVGVAGIATGTVIFATMPRRANSATLSPFVSPSHSGILVAGNF